MGDDDPQAARAILVALTLKQMTVYNERTISLFGLKSRVMAVPRNHQLALYDFANEVADLIQRRFADLGFLGDSPGEVHGGVRYLADNVRQTIITQGMFTFTLHYEPPEERPPVMAAPDDPDLTQPELRLRLLLSTLRARGDSGATGALQ